MGSAQKHSPALAKLGHGGGAHPDDASLRHVAVCYRKLAELVPEACLTYCTALRTYQIHRVRPSLAAQPDAVAIPSAADSMCTTVAPPTAGTATFKVAVVVEYLTALESWVRAAQSQRLLCDADQATVWEIET